MKLIKKLTYLLSSNELKFTILLIIIMILVAILETAGVASLMPFIAVLTKPEIVETNIYLQYLFNFGVNFGIKDIDQFLVALGLLVLFLLIFSLILKSILTYFYTHFVRMLEYSIGKRILESFLQQPYVWFLNRNSAEIGKSILSEITTVIDNGFAPMMSLISQSILSLTLLVLLIFIDPKIALLVGITFFISYAFIYKFTRNFLNNIGKERLKANELRFTTISEAFNATKEIKLGGLEKPYIEKFAIPSRNYAKCLASSRVVSELPRFGLEAISFGGILILILYLMVNNASFLDILPLLSVYVYAGYRLMPALQQMYHCISILRFVGPALDALIDDLKNLPNKKLEQNEKKLNLKKSITLDNISYKYPNAKKTALKDISIKIPTNKFVSLIGSTGSGKTTTIDIILGLLTPEEGNLEIDGNIINEANRRIWQNSIGYVPQNIYLTDDTIERNIAFGVNKENINPQQVIRASKIANLHNFIIDELPQKYNTNIGERGIRLSGGQRQRIGIARALYHDPQVLILDEATNALDGLTERVIMDAIQNIRHKMTIILITHRLNAIKNCDIIFMLEKGKLIDQGSYKFLNQNNKKFKEMNII